MSRTPGAMPKRVLLAFALLVAGLVACGNNNPYGLLTTPSPGPTGTNSPNPTIMNTTVEVIVQNSPLPGALVSEATPGPGGHVTGATPIAQATTGPNGTINFGSLIPGQSYCWWYVASPTITASNCTPFWQNNIIELKV